MDRSLQEPDHYCLVFPSGNAQKSEEQVFNYHAGDTTKRSLLRS